MPGSGWSWPGWWRRCWPAGPGRSWRQPSDASAERGRAAQAQPRIDKVRKSVNDDVRSGTSCPAQLRDAELGVQSAPSELDEIRAQRLERRGARARTRGGEGAARTGAGRRARRAGRRAADRLRQRSRGAAETSFESGRSGRISGACSRITAISAAPGRTASSGIQDKLEHLALVREKIVAEKTRLEDLEQQQRAASGRVEVVAGGERAQAVRDRPADQDPRWRAAAAAVAGEVAREAHRPSCARRIEAAAGSGLRSRRRSNRSSGKLPWPVQQGKVLARFGQPRAGGSLKWQGMLIGTDRGARVRAPYGGARRLRRLAARHGADARDRPRRRLHEPVWSQRGAVPQSRRGGRGRGRDRFGRRFRRPQPARAVFRGASRHARRSTPRPGCSDAEIRVLRPWQRRAMVRCAQNCGVHQGLAGPFADHCTQFEWIRWDGRCHANRPRAERRSGADQRDVARSLRAARQDAVAASAVDRHSRSTRRRRLGQRRLRRLRSQPAGPGSAGP